MNSGHNHLRFTQLVGVIDNQLHSEVFELYKQDLLDFDKLHCIATDSSHTVAESLHQLHGEDLILDYGDEPVLTEFHRTIYAAILDNVEQKYPAFRGHYTKLFDDVCAFTENQWNPSINPLTKAKGLQALLHRVSQLLVFSLMNLEIIDGIYKLNYQKFARPFWRQLFDFASPKSEQFRDFMLHGVLVGMAQHLRFMVQEMKKQYPIYVPYETPNEEDDPKKGAKVSGLERGPLINIPMPDDPMRDMTLLFLHFEKSLHMHTDLLGSYNQFLTIAVERLPVRYNTEEYFLKLFKSYSANPVAGKKDYMEALYQIPLVIDKDAPEESPVYNMTDLIIVFVHTFIAYMNSYGLGISAYLYTSFLHIDVAISGVIQAAVPAGSFIFGFFWNWITSYKSYKGPYILSVLILIAGNFLYYIAQTAVDYNSSEINIKGIIILVAGRLLMGIGGARLMTRKYVAMAIKPWAATKYSSILVAVSFAAICIGPGIQAIIFFAPWDKNPHPSCITMSGTEMCHHNMFAFIWIFLWIALGIVIMIFFTGYDKKKEEYEKKHKYNSVFVFRALHRLDFKSAVGKLIEVHHKKMKVDDIKNEQKGSEEIAAPPAPEGGDQSIGLLDDGRQRRISRRNSEMAFSAGAKELIVEKMDDPFMALIEQNEMNELNKEYQNSSIPIVDISASSNPNRMVNPTTDLRGSGRHFDWRSKFRYLVYHPAAYTYFATFILFLDKVGSPDFPGVLQHGGAPALQGLLPVQRAVGRLVLAGLDHLQ